MNQIETCQLQENALLKILTFLQTRGVYDR